MLFEITGKDTDGNVSFKGIANRTEATYLMNVGVNYLLAKGSEPTLTGKEEEVVVAPSTNTLQ